MKDRASHSYSYRDALSILTDADTDNFNLAQRVNCPRLEPARPRRLTSDAKLVATGAIVWAHSACYK